MHPPFYLGSSSLEMNFLARLQSVFWSCSGPAQPHLHLQGNAQSDMLNQAEWRMASLRSETLPLHPLNLRGLALKRQAGRVLGSPMAR